MQPSVLLYEFMDRRYLTSQAQLAIETPYDEEKGLIDKFQIK